MGGHEFVYVSSSTNIENAIMSYLDLLTLALYLLHIQGAMQNSSIFKNI